MILVVSPNTALDRTLVVPGLALGRVFRVAEEISVAGGKGGNVARFLHALGVPVTLVAVLGGHVGRRVREHLDAVGVPVVDIPVQGETRICDVLLDPQGGHPTVVNGQGPPLAPEDVEALVGAVQTHLPRARGLVLSGSLPPGAPTDLYRRLIALAQERGIPAYLDASGPPLAAGIEAGPHVVKVNREEFALLAGQHPEGEAGAAQQLLTRGTAAVVLTDGARGARLYTEGGLFTLPARKVAAVNPVGCGDAFLAGFIAGLERRGDLRHALAVAVAVSGAKAARLAPVVLPEDAELVPAT